MHSTDGIPIGNFIRVKQLNIFDPFPSFVTTVSGLPSAIGLLGHHVFVTDEAGGPVLAFSDNSDWRRWTDRAVVS